MCEGDSGVIPGSPMLFAGEGLAIGSKGKEREDVRNTPIVCFKHVLMLCLYFSLQVSRTADEGGRLSSTGEIYQTSSRRSGWVEAPTWRTSHSCSSSMDEVCCLQQGAEGHLLRLISTGGQSLPSLLPSRQRWSLGTFILNHVHSFLREPS